MSETYYETPKVKVIENHDIKAACISFKDTVKSDEYRTAMEKNYELCQKPGIKNWLQNNTDAGILSVEDQTWVSKDLIPRAAQHVDKIAVVISKDVFRKFAAENILSKEKGKLNFEYFNSLKDAETWLAK